MRGRVAHVLIAGVMAAAAGTVAAPRGHAAVGLPADLVPWSTTQATGTFATTQYAGGSPATGQATWREVNNLGNGAEKFITTDQNGTIYDIGGRYLIFSKDGGATWTAVEPQQPLVNAEGALSVAPNGDIVGVTWDPYSGDQLFSYKYDAASGQWLWLQNPSKTPFYDRPELDVIPGPFTISNPSGVGTTTVPYISLVSSHGSPYVYSTDGLTYDNLVGTGAAVTQWIPTTHDSNLDWDQTQIWSPMRALGGGWALDYTSGGGAEDYSPTDNTTSSPLALFSPVDMSLHPLTLPDASSLSQNLHVDSLGRLHQVVIDRDGSGFTYSVSADGGQSWNALDTKFAPYNTINSNTGGQVLDFRVNAHLGEAALVTRTNAGTAQSPPHSGSPQQDWVYKFDITGAAPRLVTRYVLGQGNNTVDTAYIGTYETSGHRYDFASLAMLPDGRVATSFMDESTVMPFPTTGLPIVASALAIEQPAQSTAAVPEAPWAPWLLLAGGLTATPALVRRRRRRSG
jgi:hypothetical protein